MLRTAVRSSLSLNQPVDVLRNKIDLIDAKIITLLNQRASLAKRIGHSKISNNQDIYAPGREKAVLDRVSRLSRGPLPESAVRAVFREIISGCRSLEAPLKAVYFGAEASYTHLAARDQFGSGAELYPSPAISDVFREVRQGRAAFGIVPIENSTEGVVAHTLDLLVQSELNICAEVFLDIHHTLLSADGRGADLRRIVSHPQALAQCRGWLAANFPGVPLEEVASTAHAAMLARSDNGVGAIASPLAREVYGLKVIAANIEDRANNITRFLVIGKGESARSGSDKTSLVFSVKDEPGILHRMLQPFARARINLTKIESRPLKERPWEYLFFIDCRGHKDEPRLRRAIKALAANCDLLKILGSYPSGR
jgi:chorismate mutase/prephenate dehydratase